MTSQFLNIPQNPLNISYFCRKLTPILNHLGQNFQSYHALVGVEEEDAGPSMFPAFAILENCCFSAFRKPTTTLRHLPTTSLKTGTNPTTGSSLQDQMLPLPGFLHW